MPRVMPYLAACIVIFFLRQFASDHCSNSRFRIFRPVALLMRSAKSVIPKWSVLGSRPASAQRWMVLYDFPHARPKNEAFVCLIASASGFMRKA